MTLTLTKLAPGIYATADETMLTCDKPKHDWSELTAWLDRLAAAFGGYGQLPDETVGAALRGWIETGGFAHRLDEAISRIAREIAGPRPVGVRVEFVEERIRRGFFQRGVTR